MSASGRGVIFKKDTVNDAHSFDILLLQNQGMLKHSFGTPWTCTWSRCEQVVARITYSVEAVGSRPHAIRFQYAITDRETGQKQDYDYLVQLSATACNFGGERWWFICPLTVGGRPCRRRCRILYLPWNGRYFGCRECYGLSYDSRQMSGSKGYEGFLRPYKMMQQAEAQLEKAHSAKAKEKAYEKLIKAGQLFHAFNLSTR